MCGGQGLTWTPFGLEGYSASTAYRLTGRYSPRIKEQTSSFLTTLDNDDWRWHFGLRLLSLTIYVFAAVYFGLYGAFEG